MVRYAITIFLSAFLLFQVQPLIGKFILPWFGGGPAIWTTCMVFFQVVLLAGYSYAHFISSRFSPRTMRNVHLALLAASLATLPIAPDPEIWKAASDSLPVGRILLLLAATIGLPYFLLSSTGPLLQESFHRETGQTPYRLYSLSNVGSLLALLSYPFLFEPQLTLRMQIIGWSVGYGLFVVLCGWCAWMFARLPANSTLADMQDSAACAQPPPQPRAGHIILWLALSACGSVMLLATTNQVCQEVTAVPFLWVLPLGLYLFSFIVCFDHERWYHRGTFLILLTGAVVLACYVIVEGNQLVIWKQLAAYSATLFVCCMVCHGELVHSKPAPRYATLFYLVVSAGGALGGILVAIVAPLILPDFWEYHMGLIATVVLAFFASFLKASEGTRLSQVGWAVGGVICVALGLGIGLTFRTLMVADPTRQDLETTRNFYGVLHVYHEDDPNDDNGPKRELIHGAIEHGFQYLDPEKAHWPTTYYGHTSGIGLAIDKHPRRKSVTPRDRTLRVGIVGLGCGTLATYGETGDYFRFYEINPAVVRIANEYFTYQQDSAADLDVILGDARINLESELAKGDSQHFDVLAIDAFSSDSIPMHLLTTQSVELYFKHLKPDGLLCIHISNRFLDLGGVVVGIANELKKPCVFVDSDGDPYAGLNTATWAIMTSNREFLDSPEIQDATTPWDSEVGKPIVWTDDYGSLWQVLKN